MINLNPLIYSKLKELNIRVVKNFPKADSDYPCIVYKEISNVPYIKSQGVEIISDISYQFEIYSLQEVEVKKIASDVNRVISSLGFNRKFNESLDSARYYRRTLRYSGKYDSRTNLIYE